MVVRTRAFESHNPEHVGPLSIKCAYNGEEMYELGNARFAVDDGHYLLMNGGERYRSSISSETQVESFCVFFAPTLVQDVLTVLATKADTLLSDPTHRNGQPVHFFQKLYPHDAIISPALERLRSLLDTETVTRGWFEDQFPLLLERLLHVHRNEHLLASKLPAVRGTTRAELYRRLTLARDFIDASLGERLNIAAVAEVACMSYYHFLRSFRHAFGETPHKYLTRRRLERARRLLERTDLSVTEICDRVGFESLTSFSWLFSRRVGASPEAYRKARRSV